MKEFILAECELDELCASLFGGLLGRMTTEFKEYMKNKTLGDMISCQKEERTA